MRVDDGERRRQHRRHAVVIGDDDVDAALAGRGDLGDAGRPAVDGHDERDARRLPPPRARRATGRGPHRAGSGRRARRRARSGAGRGSGSPGRSAHRHRSRRRRAPARRDRGPACSRAEDDPGIGQQARDRAGRRAARRTRPSSVVAGGRTAGCQQLGQSRSTGPISVATASGRRRCRDRVREDPAKARFEHGVRMPWAAAPRIYRPVASRVSAGSAADARTAGRGDAAVASVVPALPVDEQRARRRRSTSRSRRRSRSAAPG